MALLSVFRIDVTELSVFALTLMIYMLNVAIGNVVVRTLTRCDIYISCRKYYQYV